MIQVIATAFLYSPFALCPSAVYINFARENVKPFSDNKADLYKWPCSLNNGQLSLKVISLQNKYIIRFAQGLTENTLIFQPSL